MANEKTDSRRVFRAKRGDVPIAILGILAEQGSATGYRLAKLIREKSDEIWTPSAGSIYPVLENLMWEKLIVNAATGFQLTSTGHQKARVNKKVYDELWNFDGQEKLLVTHIPENLGPIHEAFAKLERAVKIIRGLSSDLTAEQRIAAVKVLKQTEKSIYTIIAREQ